MIGGIVVVDFVEQFPQVLALAVHVADDDETAVLPIFAIFARVWEEFVWEVGQQDEILGLGGCGIYANIGNA